MGIYLQSRFRGWKRSGREQLHANHNARNPPHEPALGYSRLTTNA